MKITWQITKQIQVMNYSTSVIVSSGAKNDHYDAPYMIFSVNKKHFFIKQ